MRYVSLIICMHACMHACMYICRERERGREMEIGGGGQEYEDASLINDEYVSMRCDSSMNDAL